MSVASRESEERYPRLVHDGTDCYQQVFDSRDLQEAYERGRIASLADEEIEAAAQYVKDSATNFFGTPAVSKVPEHRLRKFTKGILNAARKAVRNE